MSSIVRLSQLLSGVFGRSIPLPANSGLALRSTDQLRNAFVIAGTGTPEANVTAPIGSLYINRSGGASTTLYVKTSGTGNTGWTAK